MKEEMIRKCELSKPIFDELDILKEEMTKELRMLQFYDMSNFNRIANRLNEIAVLYNNIK
jgi:hypothetical protein